MQQHGFLAWFAFFVWLAGIIAAIALGLVQGDIHGERGLVAGATFIYISISTLLLLLVIKGDR